jgi:hypothetical protein
MEDFNYKQIRNIPLGVKIISILHYITSLMYFLFGLSSLIFPKRIATGIVISNSLDSSLIGTISTAIIIFSIVLIGGMTVLEFFMARGLQRRKRWTRVIVVIFSIINLIFLISLLFLSQEKILGIIISLIFIIGNGTILGYLLFNRKVKEVFRK